MAKLQSIIKGQSCNMNLLMQGRTKMYQPLTWLLGTLPECVI